MSITFLVWLAIGAAVGASHARALWRTAHCPSDAIWDFLRRLPLVAVTLIVATRAGRLTPAASGWAAGLLLTAVTLAVERKRWT